MSRFLDDSTYATGSGLLHLNEKMLRAMPRPDMPMSLSEELELERRVREYIWHGDTQPALMVSARPCRIAVYSVDVDGVVMLWLPDWYVDASGLAVGDRLVSVNTYGRQPVPDLTIGPRAVSPWLNICPNLACLMSDDTRRIAELTSYLAAESGWERCAELASRYLAAHPGRARHAHPALSGVPDSAAAVCGTVTREGKAARRHGTTGPSA